MFVVLLFYFYFFVLGMSVYSKAMIPILIAILISFPVGRSSFRFRAQALWRPMFAKSTKQWDMPRSSANFSNSTKIHTIKLSELDFAESICYKEKVFNSVCGTDVQGVH